MTSPFLDTQASACRHGEYVKRTNEMFSKENIEGNNGEYMKRTNEVFWNKTPNVRLSLESRKR